MKNLVQHSLNIFIWIYGGHTLNQQLVASIFSLTMADDFTRVIWTNLMLLKCDVSHLIPIFHKLIQTQFNANIRIIRSNNALELNLHTFFQSKWHNLLQILCWNSTIECCCGEKVSSSFIHGYALIYQASLLLKFLGELILIATHIINKLPSQVMNFKTLFKCLFGKVPNYHHLKVFGCLAFACAFRRDRNELSPRSRRCNFLGYPIGVKGYKLYDLDSHIIFISRDLIVFECAFRFDKQHNQSLTSKILDSYVKSGHKLHHECPWKELSESDNSSNQ